MTGVLLQAKTAEILVEAWLSAMQWLEYAYRADCLIVHVLLSMLGHTIATEPRP
jgi:hypothetical protein